AEKAKIKSYISDGKLELFKNKVRKDPSKLKYHYLNSNDEVIFCPNEVVSEFYQWWVRNAYITSENVTEETRNSNFKQVETYDIQPFVPIFCDNFAMAVESLHKIWHYRGDLSPEYLEHRQRLCNKYPNLEDALETIGFERLREMNYRKYNIERYLKSQVISPATEAKLARAIYSKCSVGERILTHDMRLSLFKIFNELGIGKRLTAKGVFKKYGEIEEEPFKIRGSNTKHLVIHSSKADVSAV